MFRRDTTSPARRWVKKPTGWASSRSNICCRLRKHLEAHRLGPQDLLFHAERLRAEHLAWRGIRDTVATMPWLITVDT